MCVWKKTWKFHLNQTSDNQIIANLSGQQRGGSFPSAWRLLKTASTCCPCTVRKKSANVYIAMTICWWGGVKVLNHWHFNSDDYHTTQSRNIHFHVNALVDRGPVQTISPFLWLKSYKKEIFQPFLHGPVNFEAVYYRTYSMYTSWRGRWIRRPVGPGPLSGRWWMCSGSGRGGWRSADARSAGYPRPGRRYGPGQIPCR